MKTAILFLILSAAVGHAMLFHKSKLTAQKWQKYDHKKVII